jgi:hypothetical protein
MAVKGYRLPQQQQWGNTINHMVWDQFPAIMETGIKYFAHLPSVGTYKHFNPSVVSFQQALHENNTREFTLSGVGSLLDYERYGHVIKRPTPQLNGSACNGNSLCIEPTCFGMTEGVIESNNQLRNFCVSLSLPCIKDYLYSDRMFEQKMEASFSMFFKQPQAMVQAYQRGNLLKEAIKVVASDVNIRYTGSTFGGGHELSLPFYINPADPYAFPDTANLPGKIGGLNLDAFASFVAPRLFSGAFDNGMQGVQIYGLDTDFLVAKQQTASVVSGGLSMDMLKTLSAYGLGAGTNLDKMFSNFTHDPMFPTFALEGTQVVPVTQEILEPSTIAGYIQTDNPAHRLNAIRGLLFVPNNWKYNLVEPPRDDFSSLGLGGGLNFLTQTPGVQVLMSSSMFARNKVAKNGTFWVGQAALQDGRMGLKATGVEARERAIREAVRTELILTHVGSSCAADGQNPNVGPAAVAQGLANGFALKSKVYVATDVRGTAKPVLVLFKIDEPRNALPIKVCSSETVEVTLSSEPAIVDCGPGNTAFVVLTFDRDMSSTYTAGNVVAYRTGPKGATYQADVSSVSGSVVVIQSLDDTTILPCCAGAQDDYGTQAELIKVTGATATSSEIMKASCTDGILTLELFDALAAGTDEDTATITLQDGTEIAVALTANATGVFVTVDASGEEACDLCDLDCACLIGAVFAYDA